MIVKKDIFFIIFYGPIFLLSILFGERILTVEIKTSPGRPRADRGHPRPLLEEDEEKNYENHLLEWSNYCEGLKERAREVIGIIRAGTVSQVEKDRQYALSLARGEGREADG